MNFNPFTCYDQDGEIDIVKTYFRRQRLEIGFEIVLAAVIIYCIIMGYVALDMIAVAVLK